MEIAAVRRDVPAEERRDAGEVLVAKMFPAARSWATMRSMWTVFQTSTAFDMRLSQLALFMISS
jgi:hypothetical protein